MKLASLMGLATTFALTLASSAALAQAKVSGFMLSSLPAGKSVTIPRPATTIVPITSRVMLTGTDLPQSISFRAMSTDGASQPVRISIYDRNSERVKYIDLKPGTSVLYTVRDLATITVVPDIRGREMELRNLALVVESDKPLEIAH